MDAKTYDDRHSLYWAIELMDPFQLYWTTSHGGQDEIQTEDAMYHVRLHNVLSAL